MKKIIIGQLMMWSNLVAVVIGYVLYQKLGIESQYLQNMLGFLGVVGSCLNLFFAIALQFKGYREDDILKFDL